MKNPLNNPLRSALYIFIAVFAVSVTSHFKYSSSEQNSESCIKVSEKKLEQMHEQMIQSINKITQYKSEKEFSGFFMSNDQHKKGISYYVLIDNKLAYWSDNEPVISDSLLLNFQNDDVLHLANGDFLAYKIKVGNNIVAGLILVKHSYEYENKYLVNNFNPAIGLGNAFNVSSSGYVFHLPGNKFSYTLGYDPAASKSTPGWILLLYFTIYFYSLIAFYFLIVHFSKSSFRLAIIILFVVALRTIMIYLKIPGSLYDHEIFSPRNYASSFYFNSLGDMLLNAMLIVTITAGIYRITKFRSIPNSLFILNWTVSAVVINSLIRGLVINSKISFELSSPTDINTYSILAFVSISMLLISFLFMTAAMLKNINGYSIKGRHVWMGVTICGLYTAIALSVMNNEKEHEVRKLIAQKAEMRQDHVAEFLFREQEEKIESDLGILSIIHSPGYSSEKLFSYLSQKYFNGYLSKFDLSVQVYDRQSIPDSNINLNYYQRLAYQGKPTNARWLYFIENESGGSSYLAIIPLNEAEHRHSIVIMMTGRFLHSAKGFPELFMSGSYRDATPSDDYSIARYSRKSLVYEYGSYVYPLTSREFPVTSAEYSFADIAGYSHLIYRIDSNSFIVVSRQQETLLGVLTLFSWMFTFVSLLSFLILITGKIIGEKQALEWNLTRRMQASVIFLVVLTFVLVGSGTVYYINSKYANDQRKSISDQVNALWFMITDNIFTDGNGLKSDSLDQKKQLDRLVSNTNIDFNIFNADGKMVYSSQPKIFDRGIVSSRMNPGAFFNIKEKGVTQYIHPENAGLLRYVAAYAPFTDRSGNITAFLNLPYFEKQNELNKEVSVFLSALVNIYVLLFALALFVTIFISSRITKPLILLQEKMSGIKLGTSNEKIEYSRNDEIGRLVHEYNRMIDELAISAGKLAQSERETAWREMARQVAHEIKNPLTPMKLSVQHLHRAFKEKGTDKDLVDRITETLIQQIDTLSNIATAFSNFAQMPRPVPMKTDLKELLNQVSDLYSDGIDIQVIGDGDFFVMADKDQMIGIFSNLLKNAVQSIPPERQGLIGVSLGHDGGSVVVEITDNGIGIPENQRDKIFIPSFTTKSSGMGLGLAIVKNIVEEASGTIWFVTDYGKGSSFFVSLPAVG